ncbi:MAG: hypothetical protein KME45_02925 [Stenomitos rutilans HA7619-LM2]|jgi:hypothetical protein|nr:hypothetical protein [Stenomitos rutilans HA7619-LM2]MBW4469337.1 hypothetical protein [Stenomitos rutilans HA7619-LM2]
MSTIDLSSRAFRCHTAQQLVSSPSLRSSILEHLFCQLSHRTMIALGSANLRFAYVPGVQPFLIVQYEPGPATICQPAYWQELEELCWQVVFTTGITSLQFVGSDTTCRRWLDATGRWVRESL